MGKFNRYSKEKIKRYADQLRLEPIVKDSEPHKIVRCVKCDEAKNLEWRRDGDNCMYYICKCGFESEPMGPAPFYLK